MAAIGEKEMVKLMLAPRLRERGHVQRKPGFRQNCGGKVILGNSSAKLVFGA